MLKRTPLIRAVLATCVFALSGGTVHAQSCGGTEIYNESFDIDAQIDSVRYVNRVVARKDRLNNFILEFVLERSDTQTREWWEIKYTCDSNHDLNATVEVEGVVHAQFLLADALGDPRISFSSSGFSAEVRASEGCADPDLQSFKIAATAGVIARLVAGEVLNSVVDQMAPPPQPPGHAALQQCLNACPQTPGWCLPPDDPQLDCVLQSICQLSICASILCAEECTCNHSGILTPPLTPAQVQACLDRVHWRRIRCFDRAYQQLQACIESMDPCNQ